MATVLVTGGSGFLGGHLILQLLNAGHVVRTTVRSHAHEDPLRAVLTNAGADAGQRLSFFVAHLERDDGWASAVSGCDYVIHSASPLPLTPPRTDEELIVPARDGTLRVLKAARDANVKRVVHTSTCGAVYYGHPRQKQPFDETSWSNLNKETSAYVRSKTIAERAAWDFMAQERGALELSVVNPSGIFGPVLGPDFSSKVDLVRRLMNGGPGCMDLYFRIVDVRDVADLHLRAMTHPAAKGERFIAAVGNAMSMREIALVLKARMGRAAHKVPTRKIPSWVVRSVALVDKSKRHVLPLLGDVRSATGAKAQRVLGWRPRSREDAIVATAESLLEFGIV